jgi:uncharacterized protein (TIGR00661 family)
MIRDLRLLGHEIYTLLSGDQRKPIWDIQFFEPYTIKRGLTFCSSNGNIRYFKTIKQLNFIRYFLDILFFKADSFDLVISDYEPITARVAQYKNIPSIGIGHLYAFCYKVPISQGPQSITCKIMNHFAPVDIPLGLHWHHFDQPILPPMIPKDVQTNPSTIPEKILVYLPFEDIEETKVFLSDLNGYTFFVYCQIDKPYRQGKLEMRPLSRSGFLQDLHDCSGVICNAGFSLLSEAIHLGKKILAKPLIGQIEQESNALALEELKFGQVMPRLDPHCARQWLGQPLQQPQDFSDVVTEVTRWIDKGKWEDTQTLVKTLWN